MKQSRKLARERLNSIRTVSELRAFLAEMRLTDEEREIGFMIFAYGWSYARIAAEVNLSERQVKRKVARIYDRLP